jgi:MoaA/NifB/PqqE/SkfB family radical SAM enzyme
MPQLKSLQIELTARCNERCIHCYIPHESKTRDMDTTLLFSLLDQCRDMSVEQIIFSGGEPMMHPNFLEMVSKTNWDGLKLRIFSNLTLLNNDIITKLKAFHVYEVQASLYSVEPEIHDAVTQMPGSCEKTKDGIEKLVENNIPAFISCPLMKQNKNSYPDVLAYAKSLQINSAPDNMIFAKSDGGIGNITNRLSLDEALAVIQSIQEHDTAYNYERFLPGYNNPEEALSCVQSVCKNSMCVNAKGEALPELGWNYVLGNLHIQSLRDIWENSVATKKIRALSLDDFPQCRACSAIEFCGMSLAGNANESGDHLKVSPHVCDLAHATQELIHAYYGQTKRKF